VVGLLLVAAGVWTGVRLVLVRSHLQDARTQLAAVRDDLLAGKVSNAQAALRFARSETSAATSLSHDPVTRAWSHVPILGRSVRVLQDVAVASDDLATRALSPALTATQALSGQGLRRPDGSLDLSVLARGEDRLRDAGKAADAVGRQLRAVPGLVPGGLAGARDKLADEASRLSAQLGNAQDALDAAPVFFGQGTTKHWFVLIQQPGESRGTGGIPGGFAVIEARDGRVSVTASGSNKDLKNFTIAPPAGLPAGFAKHYEVSGTFDIWQNVNLSPDLPAVAKIIAARWKAQTGGKVDGVLTIDPAGLADLLQGTPDLTIGPTKVSVQNLQYYLGLQQYANYKDFAERDDRKDDLALAAREVINRITGPGGDSSALLRGLLIAVRDGRIHFASDDPVLQPILERTGFDGGLPKGDAPVAYPVLYNGSGGKLDYFVDRSVSYSGAACSGSRRKTSVSVTLNNKAPAVTTLPGYVTFNLATAKPSQSSTDIVVLQVYATRGATLRSATLNGKKLVLQTYDSDPTDVPLIASSESGLPIWQVTLSLVPNQAQKLVLDLDEPVTKGKPRVPEQPLTQPLRKNVSLPVCA
jgi:hypothetical protein